jgi:CRISPR-associated protein Cmr4
MKTLDFYLIRAISNLHVGSGEGDFSVIDKQVQRDPITQLPTIHSSGIKGALREAMEYEAKNPSEGQNADELKKIVIKIFGTEPKPSNNKVSQGLNNFFEGKLLALPIRSSRNFYYLATCPNLLNELAQDLETLQNGHQLIDQTEVFLAAIDPKEGTPFYFGTQHPDLRLEDWTAQHQDYGVGFLEPLMGTRIALLHNDDFAKLASELPIIARNYLENGISQNLWYEEAVPREARFYTPIARHRDEDGLNDFLTRKQQLVQIGANATVGYGLCAMTKI